MAKQVLTDCRVFVAGADLSGFANKVEIKRSAESKETTNFRSGGDKEFIGGLQMAEVTLEGLWEAGDGTKPDDALDANVGVVGPWTVCPTDSIVGALAYVLNPLQGDFNIGGSVGDVSGYTASGTGSGPRARGMILHPPGTARTATGTGTSVQLGTVATGKSLYANLHVLSVAGTSTPTITARIESDNATNFPSPVTVGTFTAATASGGQRLTVAGPQTDDWYRVAWTISGSSPSFLFAVSLGIA